MPEILRKKIKKRLHGAHMEIQGTLRSAREAVYWLETNAELTELIFSCEICASHQAAQQKEPLISHEVQE